MSGLEALLTGALAVVSVLLVSTFARNRRQRRTIEKLREGERRARGAAEAALGVSEADRLKKEFLATMSHELRTPLNSIIGFSAILAAQLGEKLDDRQVRFLDYIHASGEHLLAMINDILDLSRIEAGSLNLRFERFPISEVLESLSSVLGDRARERSIRIETELEGEAPLILADPIRIKQTLYNLLSNAIKFSYEDSMVRISVRSLGEDESPLGAPALKIAVTDTGIGIDPADQGKIFREFYQVDGSTSREFEGTGLGLTLVRRFVELHHGLVEVESAVGRGSTFTVYLPQSRPPAEETSR